MEAPEEWEVILERRRQKHLGAPSRNQQSLQLTEMGQSRGCEQSSLQRCVNMFLSSNSHMDTGCTLQGKSTICASQWEYG